MEVVGYLGDAQLGSLQQERRFHEKHMVNIIDNSAASDLTDNTREIDRGDVKFGGVERDVMVFRKVAGQYADEADEYFLNALRCLAVYDGMILGILQVKQEYGIEHAQYFIFINVVGMKIADNFTHLHEQMLCGIWG